MAVITQIWACHHVCFSSQAMESMSKMTPQQVRRCQDCLRPHCRLQAPVLLDLAGGVCVGSKTWPGFKVKPMMMHTHGATIMLWCARLLQMTDMQRQMAQLQPDFLRSQMAAMQNIPPDVLRQRMAAASTLDPSQMQAQFSQAATAARQQEEHQVSSLLGMSNQERQPYSWPMKQLIVLSADPLLKPAQGGGQPPVWRSENR